jgi:hypothetical protein
MAKKRSPKKGASRQQVKAEPHKSEAAYNEPQAQDDGLAPVTPPVLVGQVEAMKAPDRTSRRDKKTEKPQQSNDRWMTRFTGLILFVTAISMGAAILQWRSTERAIEVGNRAYVNVNKLTFIFREPEHNELRAGDFAVAGINYINKGNSPALKMSVDASIEPLHNPISEPMEVRPSGKLPRVSAVLATDMEAYSIIKSDKPLDDAMLKALQDGSYSIYAWGTITYEDMFGNSHKTDFCFVHKPDGGINFDVCAIHNSMN